MQTVAPLGEKRLTFIGSRPYMSMCVCLCGSIEIFQLSYSDSSSVSLFQLGQLQLAPKWICVTHKLQYDYLWDLRRLFGFAFPVNSVAQFPRHSVDFTLLCRIFGGQKTFHFNILPSKLGKANQLLLIKVGRSRGCRRFEGIMLKYLWDWHTQKQAIHVCPC